jgi:hypothetical protein
VVLWACLAQDYRIAGFSFAVLWPTHELARHHPLVTISTSTRSLVRTT